MDDTESVTGGVFLNTNNCTLVTDSIDVLCLNVCGLKSKLLYPDFRDLIASKDILIFLESKSDALDVYDVPSGCCYFAKHISNF